MNSHEKRWAQMKGEYLRQVAGALDRVGHPRAGEVIEDVRGHLDERFGALHRAERTEERFAEIIEAMGPAEEYADLLDPDRGAAGEWAEAGRRRWLGGGAIVVLLVAVFFLFALVRSGVSEGKRPLVVATSPAAYRTEVDPNAGFISVTFDQPMMNLSWSWVGSGEYYPETTGRPSYDSSRRTCSLPVRLDPGHCYFVGINSARFVYFQTEQGVAAEPYVVVFATRTADGEPGSIPEDILAEARRVNGLHGSRRGDGDE